MFSEWRSQLARTNSRRRITPERDAGALSKRIAGQRVDLGKRGEQKGVDIKNL